MGRAPSTGTPDRSLRVAVSQPDLRHRVSATARWSRPARDAVPAALGQVGHGVAGVCRTAISRGSTTRGRRRARPCSPTWPGRPPRDAAISAIARAWWRSTTRTRCARACRRTWRRETSNRGGGRRQGGVRLHRAGQPVARHGRSTLRERAGVPCGARPLRRPARGGARRLAAGRDVRPARRGGRPGRSAVEAAGDLRAGVRAGRSSGRASASGRTSCSGTAWGKSRRRIPPASSAWRTACASRRPGGA